MARQARVKPSSVNVSVISRKRPIRLRKKIREKITDKMTEVISAYMLDIPLLEYADPDKVTEFVTTGVHHQ